MWNPIKDCGKQLNTGFRVRQVVQDSSEYTTEYIIKQVEFDQYELQLVSKLKDGTSVPADTAEVLVFSCSQLVGYAFEVWTAESK
ncbi:MAG: hypothetical protein V4725_15240 [Bacteroidota bacterium]